jgi:dipeptidase
MLFRSRFPPLVQGVCWITLSSPHLVSYIVPYLQNLELYTQALVDTSEIASYSDYLMTLLEISDKQFHMQTTKPLAIHSENTLCL